MKREIENSVVSDLRGVPLIEAEGNRRLTVEGSTGILLYEEGCVRVSAGKLIISFFGRGLRVRCISGSCVEIEGYISKIEFLS